MPFSVSTTGTANRGVAMKQRQTLYFSLVAGALLLAGCGQATSQLPSPALANATPAAAGTGSNAAPAAAGSGQSAAPAAAGSGPSAAHTAARANPVTQPSAEGSGPESPLQKSSGAVSLPVASLPVGVVGTLTDKNVCLGVNWLGHLRPLVTLQVTGVIIPGWSTTGDPAAAGCTAADGPPCTTLVLTSAGNDNGVKCSTSAEWQGVSPKTPPSLDLLGVLKCARSDAAACEQTLSDLKAKPAPLHYDLPPDTSSPSPGGPSSPSTPDTSSPSSPDTSTPSSPDTSSPSSPDTGSPSSPDTGTPSSPGPASP